MKDKSFLNYIVGLKGITCLLILSGHYLGIYRNAQAFTPSFGFLDRLSVSKYAFLMDEGFWLYLFFVISGYLLARSSIYDFKSLLLKCVNRFLRLALPIFFAYAVIYVIYRIVGFHNYETVSLFQCYWYQKFYTSEYYFADVLLSPFEVLFFGNTKLNGPYWVLNSMFFGSLYVYIATYCQNRFKIKDELFLGLLIVLTGVLAYKAPVIAAILVGYCANRYEIVYQKSDTNKQLLAVCYIMASFILFIVSRNILSAALFAVCIVNIPRVERLNGFFSSKILIKLGNISWGVYSFHWPVFCSIGALTMIKLSCYGNAKAYLTACVFSLALTLAVSILFYFSFEKLSAKATAYIMTALKKLTDRATGERAIR